MTQTSSSPISYPSDLSAHLAANVAELASQVDRITGQFSAAAATVAEVAFEVTTVVSQLAATSQGHFVTGLAEAWGGGSGGGVRADGENALAVLEGLIMALHPLPLALSSSPGIANGLATIAMLQSTPQASLTPSQLSVSHQAISELVSALNAVNTALLTAASSINQTVGGLRLTVCASGVVVGEAEVGMGQQGRRLLIPGGGATVSEEGEGRPAARGGGGGGKPPINTGGGPPPLTGGPEEPPLGDDEPSEGGFLAGDQWTPQELRDPHLQELVAKLRDMPEVQLANVGRSWLFLNEIKAFLPQIHRQVAEVYGFRAAQIKIVDSLPGNVRAQFTPGIQGLLMSKGTIEIIVREWSPNSLIDLLHESRHAYQFFLSRQPETSLSPLERTLAQQYRAPYRRADIHGFEAYYKQPIEVDARKFAAMVVHLLFGG